MKRKRPKSWYSVRGVYYYFYCPTAWSRQLRCRPVVEKRINTQRWTKGKCVGCSYFAVWSIIDKRNGCSIYGY